MRQFFLCVVSLLLLNACSEQPDYAFMQDNFKDNRATFAMIAAVACEVGQQSGQDKLTISAATEKSEAVLELAQTVDVESIRYTDEAGRCNLAMPVYDSRQGNMRERFMYRYNLATPAHYQRRQHSYEKAIHEVNSGIRPQIAFDMPLTKRWFFSFLYSRQAR